MPGTPGGRHAGEPRSIVSAGVVGYASPNVCAFQVEGKINEAIHKHAHPYELSNSETG